MNAQFKQSVVIDGQKFTIHQNGAPKVYSVSPKIAKHPHFKHFVKAGLIVSTDAPAEPVAQESVDERNHRLAQKIAGQKASVQKVESDPAGDEPSQEADADEESFDDMDESDFDADGDDGAEDLDEGDDVPDDEPEAEEAPKKSAKAKGKKKKKKARH